MEKKDAMSDGNGAEKTSRGEVRSTRRESSAVWPHLDPLHPAWRAFFRFCSELQHGEIERLKVQDGLPVLAELVSKKVRFSE